MGNYGLDEKNAQAKDLAKDLRDKWVEWLWPIALLVVCVSFISLVQWDSVVVMTTPLKITASLGAVIWIVWAIHSFTGDPFQRRRQAVIFAYFFVSLSFTLMLIPLMVQTSIGSEPLGVVLGCVSKTHAEELKCTDVEQVRTAPNPPATASNGPATAASSPDTEKKGKTTPQWLVNIGGSVETLNPNLASSATCTGKEQCATGCCCANKPCQFRITGGVVVPLYFIILALFGGAVSLARRVPEYQKRSEIDYIETAAEPKMLAGEVREQLLFQILQYVSAPLIAITAYEVIQPGSAATTAAVAFMCGFGSETILARIRDAANNLMPKNQTPSATGTLSGIVTNNGSPASGISVNVVNSALAATSGADGKYTIAGIPAGLCSVAATGLNVKGTAQATVIAGQTVACDIVLRPTIPTASLMGASKLFLRGSKSLNRDPSLVLTPFGYHKKSNIHKVPQDHVVRGHKDGWHIVSNKGEIVKNILAAGERPLPTPVASGWTSYAEIENKSGQPYTLVSSVWSVPPLPTNQDEQTIYLFNALQRAKPGGGADCILQPVLLYGAYPDGNGNEANSNGQWMIASFWIDQSKSQEATIFISDQVTPVAPGTHLTGVMELANTDADGTFHYNCYFDGYPDSHLPVVGTPFLSLCDQTLELYGVSAIDQLPPVHETVFSSLRAEVNGAPLALKWSPGGEFPATVETGSDNLSLVKIIYPS